jgi:CheY-like chemotaxis protein
MMEDVLNDVLSFTRMENGNLVLATAPFSLHRAVDYVALSQRGQRDVRGLGLELDLDPRIDELGDVLGDEMRFKQVCSNLVSNAFKFTQDGGVRIVTRLLYPSSTGVPARRVLIRVEVHDSGVGLCPSDVKENCLFSPYVQTEIGRRQGGKGSGLGLALVMQIIKLSQGRLGVDSQYGKGSVFWFEIPYFLEVPSPPAPTQSPRIPASIDCDHSPTTAVMAQEVTPPVSHLPLSIIPLDTPLLQQSQTSPFHSDPAPPTLSPPPSRPPPHLSMAPIHTNESPVPPRLSTLVVDDDALTRKLMSRTISRLGHDVQTAPNGQVALSLLLEAPNFFDIVFLDK